MLWLSYILTDIVFSKIFLLLLNVLPIPKCYIEIIIFKQSCIFFLRHANRFNSNSCYIAPKDKWKLLWELSLAPSRCPSYNYLIKAYANSSSHAAENDILIFAIFAVRLKVRQGSRKKIKLCFYWPGQYGLTPPPSRA